MATKDRGKYPRANPRSPVGFVRAAGKILAAANGGVVSRRGFPLSYRGGRAPISSHGFRGEWGGSITPELKFIDTATASAATPTTGTLALLNGVAQGTDVNQRIGRKMVFKSIMIRGHIASGSAASSPVGDIVRVWLVYDRQVNSATLTAAQFATQLLDATDTYISNNSLDNRDRFKVILDKTFALAANAYSAGALTTGNNIPRPFKKYIKCNYETINSGTGATIGSIASGALYLLVIPAQNNLSTYTSQIRCRYHDA